MHRSSFASPDSALRSRHHPHQRSPRQQRRLPSASIHFLRASVTCARGASRTACPRTQLAQPRPNRSSRGIELGGSERSPRSHRGFSSTPGGTRTPNLLIRRSPRGVQGGPRKSISPGQRGPGSTAVHSRPQESTENGSQLGSQRPLLPPRFRGNNAAPWTLERCVGGPLEDTSAEGRITATCDQELPSSSL
jgi:hypothetical protein